jgi:hypothetical protein
VDRRVHLEQLVEAERALDLVLLGVEVADRARGMAAERLLQIALELEALADPSRSPVRPGEHSVGPPDLDGDEIPVAAKLAAEHGRDAWIDAQGVAVDDRRAENPVDVLREALLVVRERLRCERAGENGAENERADCEHERARA